MPNPLSMLPQGVIRRVTVKSSLTPAVSFDPNAADPGDRSPSGEGPVGFLLGFLRPAAYVETAAGEITVEPYGPPFDLGPLTVVISGVLMLGTAYVVYRGIKAILGR